jgi:hypothetical protein
MHRGFPQPVGIVIRSAIALAGSSQNKVRAACHEIALNTKGGKMVTATNAANYSLEGGR